MLEKQLHEELLRYREINNYGKRFINEQADLPPAPGADAPPAGGDVPPAPGADAPPAGGDLGAGTPPAAEDTGIPPADAPLPESDSTEEIDITDLVNMTKNIKKDVESSKQDHGSVLSKMDDVFTKLDDLAAKLSEMDAVIQKIDQLGAEVKQMKPETPVEKLEMRSLDSYPFSQKPTDFFNQKQAEMRTSGKNEYVLRKDDISNYSKNTIKDTFNPENEDDEYRF